MTIRSYFRCTITILPILKNQDIHARCNQVVSSSHIGYNLKLRKPIDVLVQKRGDVDGVPRTLQKHHKNSTKTSPVQIQRQMSCFYRDGSSHGRLATLVSFFLFFSLSLMLLPTFCLLIHLFWPNLLSAKAKKTHQITGVIA